MTGKLDVREAAAKLPDLSPDTTPESIADDEALDGITHVEGLVTLSETWLKPLRNH